MEEAKGSERAEGYSGGHDHRSCKLYTDAVQGWEENVRNQGRRDGKAAQSPGAGHCLVGPLEGDPTKEAKVGFTEQYWFTE